MPLVAAKTSRETIDVPGITFLSRTNDKRIDFAARVLTCEIVTHQFIFGIIVLPLNLILVPIFSFQSISGFLQSWAAPYAAETSFLFAYWIEGQFRRHRDGRLGSRDWYDEILASSPTIAT
jgi:hypothetical protein